MRLLIATTNPGKLAEIVPILTGLAVELETLAARPGVPPAPERGTTFAVNARDKALYYARATGLTTVAEDSGLEVDALGGRPGVRSARYNGDSYPEKFRALYAELAQCAPGPHTARFVCALALAAADRVLFETQGTVEGQIARGPRGEGGFGYDPIFFYPPAGRTLAELSSEEKAVVSHRGRAFRALRAYLAGQSAGR